jgi:hypothetical protein
MYTIRQLAEAVATAEGYYVRGSRPAVSNNPGSLFPGGKWGTYPSPEVGWGTLETLLRRAFQKRNLLGRAGTWREFAWLYVNGTLPDASIIHESDARSGGPDQWLRNVLRKLGTSCSADCLWREVIAHG